jgi:hypothetical protein
MSDVETTEPTEDEVGRMVTIPGGQTIGSLERDARAVQMHAMRYSYSEIAAALGYGNRQNAHRAVKRAHTRILTKPVMTHVATSFAELDAIVVRLIGIIHQQHVVVSGGKIVRDDQTGEPLIDRGPELAALAQWAKVSESRRRLLGLDAAVKLDVSFEDSPVDREIAKLVQAMESRGIAQEQAVRRGER